MCGIAGIVKGDSKASLTPSIELMTHSLVHRGPDSSGFWVDDSSGVALGHRRLSILDLSSAGSQPMVSHCGRYILTFNGEIYNHLDLRLAMGKLAPNWKGHSDTETLLSAFSIWGINETLNKIVGMFAFGLWDSKENKIYLGRDRFGEKPLYYGWSNGTFLFASELKAIKRFPEFNNPICKIALSEYLRFMYVPAPLSIHKNVFKLEPGCILIYHAPSFVEITDCTLIADFHSDGLQLKRWWNTSEKIDSSKINLVNNEKEAIKILERKLEEAILSQSLTDVPLGAFLSGGIDSSTVVALMQKNSSVKIKTFTIGFDESNFDEAPFARAVSRHLGTEHYELNVTSTSTLDIIQSIPKIYDEPFADSSQIPTFILCKATKERVTVALSGDGGDELFGGYNRYFWSTRIWNKFSWLPPPLKNKLGNLIQLVPLKDWDRLSKYIGISRLGDKAWKLAYRLEHVSDLDSLYWSLTTEINNPDHFLILSASDKRNITKYSLTKTQPVPQNISAIEKMMYYDTMTYLPDDILCKLDRAAMSSSLETRCPFLDHRVFEFAWQIPLKFKINRDHGKQILRSLLYQYVPQKLIDRPKAGFAIPVGKWLCGPLKNWAETLLEESNLEKQGFFHPAAVRQLWNEHQSNQRDHTTKIWAILMFQIWLLSNE
jgi:asparagine synthase (glutamine-hydrolysing)